MSRRTFGLLCAGFAALFYAANYTIAKDVMFQYIEPFGFIVLRVSGAFLLFWIISFWGPKEKIDRTDFKHIAIAALFGVGINMLAFFEGLSLTTPINASVLMVTTPIMVLLLSIIFLKEKVRWKKIIGVLIGLSGTLLIILYGTGKSTTAAIKPNTPIGANFITRSVIIIMMRLMPSQNVNMCSA